MYQPSRFSDPNYTHYAPRQWFKRFSNNLEELDFCKSKADYSLFIFHKDDLIVILLIYVDDIYFNHWK